MSGGRIPTAGYAGSPVSSLLELLDDQGALDLAGGGSAGEGIDDGGTRRGCLNPERRSVQNVRDNVSTVIAGRVRPGDDHGGHDFTPLRIGDADHCDFEHIRMLAEHGLDLGRRDRSRPRCGSRRAPADHRDVSLVVDVAEIAGLVPAVQNASAVESGSSKYPSINIGLRQ